MRRMDISPSGYPLGVRRHAWYEPREVRKCPAQNAPILFHTLSNQSHSSKTRHYYIYVIEILNWNKLQLLVSNNNPPNSIRTVQGPRSCPAPSHDRSHKWTSQGWGAFVCGLTIGAGCWLGWEKMTFLDVMLKDKKYLLSNQSMKQFPFKNHESHT